MKLIQTTIFDFVDEQEDQKPVCTGCIYFRRIDNKCGLCKVGTAEYNHIYNLCFFGGSICFWYETKDRKSPWWDEHKRIGQKAMGDSRLDNRKKYNMGPKKF